MTLYDESKDSLLENFSKRPGGQAYFEESVFEYKPTTDLSVIVPCYNVENYISECLNSIVNQKTNYNFEIIAVNDGSKDNTPKILSEYEKKYSFINVINQENKGFSGARNVGIRNSKGRYLMFIDSDDYISDNYIEALMKSITDNNCDIAACGYFTFRNGKIIKSINPSGSNDRSLLNGCLWAKVFDRNLFSNIALPEGYWYEDSILAHLIYPTAKKYCSTDGCSYAYRSNPNGITISSKNNKKALDTFYVSDLMIDTAIRLFGSKILETESYYKLIISQFYLNQCRIKKLPDNIQRRVFELQSKFLHNYCENISNKSDLGSNESSYEKSMLKNDYDKAKICVKLEMFYKIKDRIKKKIRRNR